MKVYTGIGSRETPLDVRRYLIRPLADKLAAEGWTLRSGNAPGADQAFSRAHLATGCNDKIELYLPWPTFEAEAIDGWLYTIVARSRPQLEAYTIAAYFHPAWHSMSHGEKALHARNVHQVLGRDVTSPILSRFVVCWTRNAAGGGGTGQALRVARHYGVPVFDLADPGARERIERWLSI